MIKRLTIEKLRLLVDAGAVRSVELVGVPDGFALRITTKGDEMSGTLETDKGHVRTFAKLDTAAKLLHELGVGRATLDLQSWAPGQKAV
jgi:hypothetical protein